MRKARGDMGLTQVSLAHRAKIDPGTLARIERDEHAPTLRVRRALARVLRLPSIAANA